MAAVVEVPGSESVVRYARAVAVSECRKLRVRPWMAEDVISEAVVAALEAVQRWDPAVGVPLLPFVGRRAAGAVRDALRREDWLSRGDRRRVGLVGMAESLCGSSDAGVVGAVLGWDPVEVERVRGLGAGPLSFEPWMDRVVDGVDERVADADLWRRIREVVAGLPPKKRRVMEGILAGETNEAIARREGLTGGRISQILSESAAVIRAAL